MLALIQKEDFFSLNVCIKIEEKKVGWLCFGHRRSDAGCLFSRDTKNCFGIIMSSFFFFFFPAPQCSEDIFHNTEKGPYKLRVIWNVIKIEDLPVVLF